MKTVFDYLDEHKTYDNGDGWSLAVICGIYILTIPKDKGKKNYVINSETDIKEILEEKLGNYYEIRFCTVCGSPMREGYMVEDGDFYACSDECFKKDADERYGVGKWKLTEDLTEEEKVNTCWNEFGEDSYHAYLDDDGKWHPDDTFYTEWY